VLTALADRFPRRTVMIACDAVRVPLVAVLVVPGVPTTVVVAVLFVSALFAPPAQAARAAVLPEVLDGDRYVVANSISNLSTQLAQVLGFAAGGALVGALSPRGALLADAVSFAVSALVLSRYMTRRPAPARTSHTTVLRDTLDGAHLVMTDRTLRGFVLLAWSGAACLAAPEGRVRGPRPRRQRHRGAPARRDPVRHGLRRDRLRAVHATDPTMAIRAGHGVAVLRRPGADHPRPTPADRVAAPGRRRLRLGLPDRPERPRHRGDAATLAPLEHSVHNGGSTEVKARHVMTIRGA
jgi:hypothetical protein